jgi:hypothetical protein
VGINDLGDIVGVYCLTSCVANQQHGFLLHGGKYKQLDAPKSLYTWAFGINNTGQITLQGNNASGNWSGYIYQGGKFTKLKVPGSTNTLATGIDSAGDVVIWWYDSTNVHHAALYSKGAYFKFNDPKGARHRGGRDQRSSFDRWPLSPDQQYCRRVQSNVLSFREQPARSTIVTEVPLLRKTKAGESAVRLAIRKPGSRLRGVLRVLDDPAPSKLR